MIILPSLACATIRMYLCMTLIQVGSCDMELCPPLVAREDAGLNSVASSNVCCCARGVLHVHLSQHQRRVPGDMSLEGEGTEPHRATYDGQAIGDPTLTMFLTLEKMCTPDLGSFPSSMTCRTSEELVVLGLVPVMCSTGPCGRELHRWVTSNPILVAVFCSAL